MDSRHVPVVTRDPYRGYVQEEVDHESMVAEAFRSAIYRQQTDLELTNWLSNLRQQQATLAMTPTVPLVQAPAAIPVPQTQAPLLKHPSEITTTRNGKRGTPQSRAKKGATTTGKPQSRLSAPKKASTPGMCKMMTPGKPQRKIPQDKSSGADKPLSPGPSLGKPPPQATNPQRQTQGFPGRTRPTCSTSCLEKPPPQAKIPQRQSSAPEKPPPRAKITQRQSSAPQKPQVQASNLQHQAPASGNLPSSTNKSRRQAHDPGMPPPRAANPQRHASNPGTIPRQAACRTWNNGDRCRYSPCWFRHDCDRCGSAAHPRVHHDRATLVQLA